VSSFLVNHPFANRLFPGSLDAIDHAVAFGATVILSDGDVVFQRRKVERSALFDALEREHDQCFSTITMSSCRSP
jgi:hypothetical protein